MDDKQPVDRELEMVRVYAAPTPVEVELVEAAFRAHRLPYVIRYKLGYMEPTFAGDQLRMSRLLVHRSKVSEAQELLMSLGLGESKDEGPSARERFEVLLDGVGAPEAKPLDEKLWAVVPENFGDWMLGLLPDLFDRLSVDVVLGILEPLDADSVRHDARGHRGRASRCSATAAWACGRTAPAVLGPGLNAQGSACGCAPLCTALVSACLGFGLRGSAQRFGPAFRPLCLRSPKLSPNPHPTAGPLRNDRARWRPAVLLLPGFFPLHFA